MTRENFLLTLSWAASDAGVEIQVLETMPGRYLVADLIGCTVVNDETDEEIGTIYDVKNLGASDIYYIKGKDGKEYLFPAVDEFKVSTDIENKVIRVKVIEGMFGED